MTMTPGSLHPTNILLIKSHSMGIGDLLRSSAAWSALKARGPTAVAPADAEQAQRLCLERLHPRPPLAGQRPLCHGQVGHPGQGKQRSLPLAQVWAEVAQRLQGRRLTW
jgi:hypothetical protein